MEMFGERLKLRRKSRGLTQNQLGEMVGCTGRCISHYEKNFYEPNVFTLLRIAEVLGEF
ncbi:helix-turn-helix domain-containing protein [Paenibacillus alkaliterrae]|uniref:helix-turn-helix domain-containing protein n=1 Tax=Paenibacillus alkaliterrae TaxID=320909 RepID=UPI001F299D2F|nr:helix-turn-helix transcriptional regulator [Paenibacillus alkaliterrae]MCF2938919.1 helix-turn-helix domain-containing protein [Paenibacillus alkaliterrae]